MQHKFTHCDWLMDAVGSTCSPAKKKDGGTIMPEQYLALLKSLALRPSRTIAHNLEPIVVALRNAGYVTRGPEGWIATAAGCAMIQQDRAHWQAGAAASS
jgi:hypothetical protein